MSQVPLAEWGRFSVARWFSNVRQVGVSFDEAIARDDKRLPAMRSALWDIERMMLRNGPVVDELLGLPLEAARARILEQRRLAAEEKERLAAEQRVLALRDCVPSYGDFDGVRWLETAQPVLDDRVPVDLARENDAGLAGARSAAIAEFERRADDRERAARKERCRDRLEQEARAFFGDPEKAKLFISSGHSALGGRRPRDYCSDDASLATCIALLRPPKRRR